MERLNLGSGRLSSVLVSRILSLNELNDLQSDHIVDGGADWLMRKTVLQEAMSLQSIDFGFAGWLSVRPADVCHCVE